MTQKNSSIYSDEEIVDCIKNCFDLSVSGIINKLELLKPIYKELSCYGHFGRDKKLYKWEQIDKIDEIKVYLG